MEMDSSDTDNVGTSYDSLSAITHILNEEDRQMIINDAFIACTNLECEKLEKSRQNYEEKAIKLETENQLLETELQAVDNSFDLHARSIELKSETVLRLKYARDAKDDELKRVYNECEQHYNKYLAEFKGCEQIYKDYHPLYKESEAQKVRTLKMEVKLKMLEGEISDLKQTIKQRSRIRKDMRNAVIVKFARDALTYWMSRDLKNRLDAEMLSQELLLLKLREVESLAAEKEKEMKNIDDLPDSYIPKRTLLECNWKEMNKDVELMPPPTTLTTSSTFDKPGQSDRYLVEMRARIKQRQVEWERKHSGNMLGRKRSSSTELPNIYKHASHSYSPVRNRNPKAHIISIHSIGAVDTNSPASQQRPSDSEMPLDTNKNMQRFSQLPTGSGNIISGSTNGDDHVSSVKTNSNFTTFLSRGSQYFNFNADVNREPAPSSQLPNTDNISQELTQPKHWDMFPQQQIQQTQEIVSQYQEPQNVSNVNTSFQQVTSNNNQQITQKSTQQPERNYDSAGTINQNIMPGDNLQTKMPVKANVARQPNQSKYSQETASNCVEFKKPLNQATTSPYFPNPTMENLRINSASTFPNQGMTPCSTYSMDFPGSPSMQSYNPNIDTQFSYSDEEYRKQFTPEADDENIQNDDEPIVAAPYTFNFGQPSTSEQNVGSSNYFKFF